MKMKDARTTKNQTAIWNFDRLYGRLFRIGGAGGPVSRMTSLLIARSQKATRDKAKPSPAVVSARGLKICSVKIGWGSPLTVPSCLLSLVPIVSVTGRSAANVPARRRFQASSSSADPPRWILKASELLSAVRRPVMDGNFWLLMKRMYLLGSKESCATCAGSSSIRTRISLFSGAFGGSTPTMRRVVAGAAVGVGA